MSRTIVAIHAHPDDESSKGAGTVAKYTDAGTRAVLVTATGGEAGDILNPAMDRPEIAADLASVRRSELAEAAAIIGYHDVVLLGYRDSGMPETPDNARRDAFCNQPHDAVLERLVAIVRRERPQIVLGYDDHEWYPHPDHLYVHRLSMDLFAAAADPDRFPESGDPWQVQRLYAPVMTKERITALHEAMIDRVGSSPYGGWMDRLASVEGPVGPITRVDVTGYVERGRDALRAHRTQIDPNGRWFDVPTELVEEVYPFEEFELMASVAPRHDPAELDLFAGLP